MPVFSFTVEEGNTQAIEGNEPDITYTGLSVLSYTGTAVSGEDFKAFSTSDIIMPGDGSYSYTFRTIADDVFEGLETATFKMRLSYINDDDGTADTFSFTIALTFWDKVFTEKANTVNFNSFTTAQSDAISEHNLDLYKALGGSDIVTLPNISSYALSGWDPLQNFDAGAGDDTVNGGDGKDLIRGGSGVDTIKGNKADDTLNGGTENDKLDGGSHLNVRLGGAFERDTAVFADPVSSAAVVAASVTSSQITVTTSEGTDTLNNIEFGKFGTKMVPLFNWHFDITRSAANDGECVISFSENGKVLFTSTGAFCDDATPINTGQYDGYFRTDATANKQVVELMDVSSGATPRTAVQIHGGSSTQNSEGCFVLPGTQLRSFMNHMEDRMGDVLKTALNGHTGYDIPVPITVTINGAVSQPVLSLGANKAVAEGGTGSIGLTWSGDGAQAGITKVVCVTLKVTQSAGCSFGEGNDWQFSGNAWNSAMAATSLNSLYNSTTGVLEFYMLGGTDSVDIGIAALTDSLGSENSETVSLKLVDLDIFNLKDGALHKYADSALRSASAIDQMLATIGDKASFVISNVPPPVSFSSPLMDTEFWA